MHTPVWLRAVRAGMKLQMMNRLLFGRPTLQVATAQLEELRAQSAAFAAELEATRQRASRAEAEAAALRSSAQHVRLQLLEEELRTAREALAAAERSAAAAAPAAGGAAVAELQQQQLGVQGGVGRQSRTAVDEENRRPGALPAAAAGGRGVAPGGEADSNTLPAALAAPWQTVVKVSCRGSVPPAFRVPCPFFLFLPQSTCTARLHVCTLLPYTFFSPGARRLPRPAAAGPGRGGRPCCLRPGGGGRRPPGRDQGARRAAHAAARRGEFPFPSLQTLSPYSPFDSWSH